MSRVGIPEAITTALKIYAKGVMHHSRGGAAQLRTPGRSSDLSVTRSGSLPQRRDRATRQLPPQPLDTCRGHLRVLQPQ